MKVLELREKSEDQLTEELIKLKKESFNLRFQKASGQLENTARVRFVRRNIARVKTVIAEKAANSTQQWRKIMPKRILQGVVTSNANEKTLTVQVERRFTHPIMKKTIRKTKKYRAHHTEKEIKVGDVVRIRECAPRSKTKTWELFKD